MPISPDIAVLRAHIGNASLRGDHDAADAARQALAAKMLERRIDAALANPGLTHAQRDDLAARLLGAAS